MSQIFLSYCRSAPDEELAQQLCAYLCERGLRVFLDKQIQVGADWAVEIDRQLRASEAFIVFLSEASILSPMVRQEVQVAHELHWAGSMSIFPVRLGFEGHLPYDLGSYLNRIQCAKWQPGEPPEVLFALLHTAIAGSLPHQSRSMADAPPFVSASAASSQAKVGPPLSPSDDPKVTRAQDEAVAVEANTASEPVRQTSQSPVRQETSRGRAKLPLAVETEVLTLSRRRCAICYGISGDISAKKGQIAHIDRNAENNNLRNLVWLCLMHHDEYDSITRQSKGYKPAEVRVYRDELFGSVKKYLKIDDSCFGYETDSILLAEGELKFYRDEYEKYYAETMACIAETLDTASDFTRMQASWQPKMRRLLEGPNKRGQIDQFLNQSGCQLISFSSALKRLGSRTGDASKKMYAALNHACAVASDAEFADASMFLEQLSSLGEVRGQLEQSVPKIEALRVELLSFARSTETFNKGKRLAVGALEAHRDHAQEMVDAVTAAQTDLEKVLSLFG